MSNWLAQPMELLADNDVRTRALGALLLIQHALDVEAATLVLRLPGKEKHSVVSSIGYDSATVEFLTSPDFTVKCAATRHQLESEIRLLDWHDVPGHIDTFAVQEVFRPKGFFNGVTLPLRTNGELVGACHVSSSRPQFSPHQKASLSHMRPALTKLAESVRASEIPSLTPRELEILELLKAGHTNAEIAARLFLSTRTVSTHVEHILNKLNCSSRAAAAAWAATHQVGAGRTEARRIA